MSFDLGAAVVRFNEMVYGAVALLPNLVVAAVVFFAFVAVARAVRALIRRLFGTHIAGQGVGLVLGRIAQWVIYFIGLLVALSIVVPTFKAGDLVQLLGISGVLIGFAFRDILQNFLAGILILLTHPFRIGDQIVFGGAEGTVEEIKTRATYLKTYDGRRAVIPNAELFTKSVTVNTAYAVRRTEYEVGIGVGDDLDVAARLMIDAMRSVEGILGNPAPDVVVCAFGDSAIMLKARWWTNSSRAAVVSAQDGVLRAIKKALQENCIDMPYPTQMVLFHDQTEETDGDRRRQREGWPSGKGEVPRPLREVREAS
jgi:small-conductance mechanosensitive channel